MIHAVGSTYTYPDGLSVRVEDIRPYQLSDPEYASGYRNGDDVVALTVRGDVQYGRSRRTAAGPLRAHDRCP
ncbi:hypothetical protein [Streptomyces sp. NPDC002133]|uniref:hypothetical protein n=1 Tax=Streptomyces sp. NPDC002133 TaxID=3154409 RepID=UPI00332E9A12